MDEAICIAVGMVAIAAIAWFASRKWELWSERSARSRPSLPLSQVRGLGTAPGKELEQGPGRHLLLGNLSGNFILEIPKSAR